MPQGDKKFMLNTDEHEIFPACWHLNIYELKK